jgi:hypothetical protein
MAASPWSLADLNGAQLPIHCRVVAESESSAGTSRGIAARPWAWAGQGGIVQSRCVISGDEKVRERECERERERDREKKRECE